MNNFTFYSFQCIVCKTTILSSWIILLEKHEIRGNGLNFDNLFDLPK